jgi:hypothetical protein
MTMNFTSNEGHYPEYLMKKVRQEMFDIEEDDTSKDKEIQSLSPTEFFQRVLEWEGIIGYTHRILSWVDDIFGSDLTQGQY